MKRLLEVGFGQAHYFLYDCYSIPDILSFLQVVKRELGRICGSQS